MTAVQQFILVDPEVYLVTGLYPVRTKDNDNGGAAVAVVSARVQGFAPSTDTGVSSLSVVTAVTSVVLKQVVSSNSADTSYFGNFSVISGVTTTVVKSHVNTDTGSSIGALSVVSGNTTTVVKTLVNNDNAQSAIASLSVVSAQRN